LKLIVAAETEGLLSSQNNENMKTNQALLEAESCVTGLDELQGELKAKVDLALSPEDIAALGSEQLSAFLQAAFGGIELQGDFSGSLIPFQLKSEGSLQITLDQLQAEENTYQAIQSVPFHWSYQSPEQFKIYPEFGPHNHQAAQFSKNNLHLFIDGPEYFKELKKAVREARESIDQEIFAFYDGETTREIARLMMFKAMGLREQRPGELEVDLFAPNGVRVFLMHNHKYSRKGTEHVAKMFAKVQQEVLQELEEAEQQTEIYQKRLQRNFKIASLGKGVMKTDHRKMLVIDGSKAYVGGLNMADHYLTHDGFHDLMIRVEGPAVREMHNEFIENWEQIYPEVSIRWNTKKPQILKTNLLGLQTSLIAVLTTDDDAPEMVETHLISLIDSAKKVIRMEHAYVYHEPIEAALRQALDRGVHLEVVFSERNDESLFELLNPATVYDLMQRAPKQVKVWLYQGKGGEYSYMAHTKYLSVDGNEAIVGSANLIPRSLHSPFWSQGKPLLFNEEMSLYIRDKKFVTLLDTALLEFDIKTLSRQVSAQDLKHLIERRGGAKQLLIERIKGLLS